MGTVKKLRSVYKLCCSSQQISELEHDYIGLANDVLDDVAQQFADLFKELQIVVRDSFMELGINFEEKAFYDILKSVAQKYEFPYPEDKL
ncbi:DUF3387 domain-containing protein [Pseudanabaena mucicola]|uniref:DUF3387 domain-containing protein n=1 Tax=Pseudanabaena mucicola FACHB-723 TaxID=2692860 RepID=A0ABR7ZW82_9CYAN|nr:DUF3387 domain-containing protein [Pseudanabaena mucicola]MBD2188024.1 DUF3387 domain-containing protein [Pseudanabaena mucicola FACHB-723]